MCPLPHIGLSQNLCDTWLVEMGAAPCFPGGLKTLQFAPAYDDLLRVP